LFFFKKIQKKDPDERRFTRNASDFAWIENNYVQSPISENNYNLDDLPDISKKIEKMVEIRNFKF